ATSTRYARRPGPLKIVATQPAGDIYGLANEVQAGHAARLHRLLIELASIDATTHDFGLAVAGSARRSQLPGLHAFTDATQYLVRCIGHAQAGRGRTGDKPLIGQPARH